MYFISIIIFIFFNPLNAQVFNGFFVNKELDKEEYYLLINSKLYQLKSEITIDKKEDGFDINYYKGKINKSFKVYRNIKIKYLDSLFEIDFNQSKVNLKKCLFVNNPYINKDTTFILHQTKKENNSRFLGDSYNLEYSSFFYPEIDNRFKSIDIDNDGSIIMGGNISEDIFPFGNKYNPSENFYNQIIVKFNSQMKLKWITIIGGEYLQEINELTVDDDNSIWIAGHTYSPDYTILGKQLNDTLLGKSDGTISKVNKNGELIFSTLHSKAGENYINSIKVKNDLIYIAGNFGRPSSSKSGFILILNSNLDVMFEEYIENDEFLNIFDIAIDSLGNMYTLYTAYNDNKFSEISIGSESRRRSIHIIKVNLDSLKIEKSIKIGGNSDDYGFNIEIDNLNNIYIFGATHSPKFPILGFNDKKIYHGYDYFICKIDSSANLIWSRIFGGYGVEGLISLGYFKHGFSLENEYLYICSTTKSNDLKTLNPIQSGINGHEDLFFIKMDTNGEYQFLSYLGGKLVDYGCGLAIKSENIHFVGYSISNNFPTTPNAYSKSHDFEYNSIFGVLGLNEKNINDEPCLNNQFIYDDFKNYDGLFLLQDAVHYDSTIRLTKESRYEKGIVWTENLVNISKGFETEFEFELSGGTDFGNKDGFEEGAEGVAFIISGTQNNEIGRVGGGIGFEGLTNSLIIELDLFHNVNPPYSDPNGNHIGIFANFKEVSANHKSTDLLFQNANIFDIKSDKTQYIFKVKFNEFENTLQVFLFEKGKISSRVAYLDNFYFKDYIDLIDDGFAYLGISAATGNSVQRHELKSWSFCGGEKLLSVNKNVDDIIYPNPVKDNVIVNEKFVMDEIQIFDLLGNRCDFLLSGNTLNLSQLNKGVYFIQVYQNNIYSKIHKRVINQFSVLG